MLCSNFSFVCLLNTKSSKKVHFRVSVVEFFEFGYFDTKLAKKQILACRCYIGDFLAYYGGQLLPKLISSNKTIRFK